MRHPIHSAAGLGSRGAAAGQRIQGLQMQGRVLGISCVTLASTGCEQTPVCPVQELV